MVDNGTTKNPTEAEKPEAESSPEGEENAEDEEKMSDIPPALKDLVVLPPRQKEKSPDEACLGLPLLRPEEPVQSIRLALSEVIGYSHMTNYRLELEEGYDRKTEAEDPTVVPPLVSPYTGPNALVSVSVHLRSLNQGPNADLEESTPVLDDFADLQSTPGIRDGSAIRMVLEAYDVASIKDHVMRLRQHFAGNPPSVTSLVVDSKEQPIKDVNVIRDRLKLPVPWDGQVKVDCQNLQDYFYLSCGEDPAKYLHDRAGAPSTAASKAKKKKKKHTVTATATATTTVVATNTDDEEAVVALTEEELTKQQAIRINELEEAMKVPCTIKYSGFHPPPAYRKFMGDLAYLEVSFPSGIGNGAAADTTLFITATTTGFYVNKSRFAGSVGSHPPVFDPSPAAESCFSHALLDCLLKASPIIKQSWEQAIAAVKERAEILAHSNRSNFHSLFRLAIRGDFEGLPDPAHLLDAHLGTPSWIVPKGKEEPVPPTWKPSSHSYHPIRMEEELTHTFGVDIRAGSLRDWNDEIQMAREMPTDKLIERLERARVLHKIMSEFGDAALLGVQAVAQGQVMPMNPNEGTRTQVFLHNNIFISRALDVGPDTFRLTKGDAAAKKSVSREIQCIKTMQRMEHAELATLGTVLIDCRGSRFMCQSVLPGILSGDKCHKVLLGSVDTDAPLNWDGDVHNLLETKLGTPLNLRVGKIYKSPLTDARREECRKLKKVASLVPEKASNGSPIGVDGKVEKSEDNETIISCVPIESKVIQGSDQRKYILDFARMTPRDANWVPENKGGTGRWESVQKDNGTTRFVPSSLEDDEWTTHILRPELVNRWIRSEFAKALESQRAAVEAKKKEEVASETDDEKKDKKDEVVHLTEEEQKEITDKLRLNVNVFFPDIRAVDEEAVKEYESRARDAATFLWDEVLPRITRAVRDRTGPQIPSDGRSLTEFLHRHGVNCRYLGRLAVLAIDEEKKDNKTASDLKHGRTTMIERMTMPKCWLEMLECEMVARASKHVLDSYLSEHCAVASWSPGQTVASFLSALVSEYEESAAQTEARLEKESGSRPDDDDMQSLKQIDVGGDGDAIPMASRSRTEIWQDIELEVARRFRYSLSLFNRGVGNVSERSLHIPLLRRICQRCGIRLLARNYKVGGACYTSGNSFGGRLTATYPISPLDVVDVVPLMKHSAAYHEGFAMCTFGPANMCSPPLQVSLIDARVALERAHLQFSSRALGPALELAQEAANLYQRVTDNQAHPGVVDCLELMATIFTEAGDPVVAADNCLKALGLAVQGNGFDSATVFGLHMSLFQMLFNAKELDKCVKHLRAAIYVLGIMGGPNHYELNGAYLKMLSTYKHDDVKGKYNKVALDVYRVLNELDPSDRLMEGLSDRRFAQTLADVGDYKAAMEAEKRAYNSLLRFVGPEHELVKSCDKSLKEYTKLAVEQGKGLIENEKLKQEAEIADAVAAEIAAAEEDDERKRKKANSKKKKGKK